jgi:threonine 3-dehydrogenase
MTIGHEYVGKVVKIGDEVTKVSIGERVTVEGHIACGFCRNCRRGRKHICDHTIGIGVNRDGGFAEYVCVPAENVLHIDSRIPDEIVSIMDPLGNATHTALSFPLIGEDVLVTGAGGPIGCMAIAICRFVGARNVVGSEVSNYRRELARKMGATLVIDPMKEDISAAMKQVGMVGGFDIGLEVSGSPVAFDSMIKSMGILPDTTQIEWDKVIFKGLTLKGIYGREMYETWYKMEKMLLSGLNISPVITHRFHFTDFQQAFEIMEEGNCGKIILDWEN